MCVAVTLEPGAELTREEIIKMGNANGDGFGFAWAEDGVVHWWKSINYNDEYFTQLISSLKDFPRFVHFRLSTIGGVRVDLCHPFEVGPLAACQEKGHANKVMMHNGHWHRSSEMFDILSREKALPDIGPWSDTRLAALLASKDEDWLTVVTGRVATLDGNGNMRLIGSWDKLRDGIMVSNTHWNHSYNYRRTVSSRRWAGWGWSEKEWEEKEKHEAEKKEREEKEAKEKEAKESAGQNGKKEKQDKEKGAQTSSGERGDNHGRTVGVSRGDRVLPAGREGVESREERIARQKERFDFKPWENPYTHEWWQVDPESITEDGRYQLRSISAAEATRALGQTTSPSGKAEREETGNSGDKV